MITLLQSAQQFIDLLAPALMPGATSDIVDANRHDDDIGCIGLIIIKNLLQQTADSLAGLSSNAPVQAKAATKCRLHLATQRLLLVLCAHAGCGGVTQYQQLEAWAVTRLATSWTCGFG